MKKSIMILLVSLALTPSAHAQTIDTVTALRVILGESEGENLSGKIAVGEVLRRAKSTKPFCSLKSIHHENGAYYRGKRKIDAVTVGQALRAWRESEHTNTTKNATHFENLSAFGLPYWAGEMEVTTTIGKHTFFKHKN